MVGGHPRIESNQQLYSNDTGRVCMGGLISYSIEVIHQSITEPMNQEGKTHRASRWCSSSRESKILRKMIAVGPPATLKVVVNKTISWKRNS